MILIKVFILHWFYLSSQIVLTWYIFYMYCYWSRYSFSGTWCMLSNGKKLKQYKRACLTLFPLQDKHNNITFIFWDNVRILFIYNVRINRYSLKYEVVLDSQPQVIKLSSRLPMVGDFSPCTPVSSTNKTGRHDISEILLKVVLKHQQ